MPHPSPSILTGAPLLLFGTLALAQSAATGPVAHPPVSTGIPHTESRVLDLSSLTNMEALLDRLTDRRVIFVGESHDRYEDHLNQLAVIQGLHARGRRLAIGMEFFQQPFQADLDAYIAGTIPEAEFLRRTQYFDRWRYDYRLYRPILQFAREQRIPVIALNLASELTAKVGDVGIAGLTEEERARIPTEIDRDDPAYRQRVESVFKLHPAEQQRDLEHFLEVQLLWDEGMAERAARVLADDSECTLIVLAGSGHLEYGQGIPQRLLRRQPVPSAILLNGANRSPDPGAADFFLYPQPVELPSGGLLGVMLDNETSGNGVLVKGFGDESGAKIAGLAEGDRIVRVGGAPIANYADIRIALVDSQPGQTLPVEIERKRLIGGDERLTFLVELH
ncbi:ChaN family lipoprotein [Thiocystis violascens]|uniref:Uncharacterized iron-regulated protein n=1 Tax=Thiocystis violascens (strain ATCC 17096 / DSM 198 / 6111) TaxID=765911 RepID=I3YA33_THIV6|nr:ChaN family lipoprotein [Thiocystis violascens]AFL73851.1 uncharacterized iron-regulated protein [Thiocystis violascens DSM 198]